MGKYFTIKELCASTTAKRKGIDNTPSKEIESKLEKLIEEVLDPIRSIYGKPIRVSSGYRSKALNKAVGGAVNSQHLYGEAADIIPKDGDVKRLFDVATHLMNVGVIEVGQLIDEYNYSWVHISLPNEKHHNQVLHIK